MALLVCDVDRFKELNDRHGHLVGDDVLRRVSRNLMSSVRARGPRGALRRRRVPRAAPGRRPGDRRGGGRAHPGGGGRPLDGPVRTATVSIGVAVLGEEHDAEGLLEQANQAMYAAKQGGRDRVVRADTLRAGAAASHDAALRPPASLEP